MDPWKHEDRPSPGCKSLLSSRTLRCGNHDRIFISWQNYFLGSYRERNQQIRNRNVRRDSCCKCWGQKYRATSRECQTTTDGQGCFEVSKFMISLLWRDESVHREEDGVVRFDDLAELFKSRFCGYLALGKSSLEKFLGKRRRAKEKDSMLFEPSFFRTFLVYQSNPRTFRRYSRWC